MSVWKHVKQKEQLEAWPLGSIQTMITANGKTRPFPLTMP
jgi:hypothetical protein